MTRTPANHRKALAGDRYRLRRDRDRLRGGTGYAIDPVCGMQVQTAIPAAVAAAAITAWQLLGVLVALRLAAR